MAISPLPARRVTSCDPCRARRTRDNHRRTRKNGARLALAAPASFLCRFRPHVAALCQPARGQQFCHVTPPLGSVSCPGVVGDVDARPCPAALLNPTSTVAPCCLCRPLSIVPPPFALAAFCRSCRPLLLVPPLSLLLPPAARALPCHSRHALPFMPSLVVCHPLSLVPPLSLMPYPVTRTALYLRPGSSLRLTWFSLRGVFVTTMASGTWPDCYMSNVRA